MMRMTAGAVLGALILLAAGAPAVAGGYWDARGEAASGSPPAREESACDVRCPPAGRAWREGWRDEGWREGPAAEDWDESSPDEGASIGPAEDFDGGVGADEFAGSSLGFAPAPGVFVFGFDRRLDFRGHDLRRRMFLERDGLASRGQMRFVRPAPRARSFGRMHGAPNMGMRSFGGHHR
jgi:hypothetical protein